jgi:hypothetical protein
MSSHLDRKRSNFSDSNLSLRQESMDQIESIDFNQLMNVEEPSRWEQSESFSEYLYFLWMDLLYWYEQQDVTVYKEYMRHFLDRFTVNITFDDVMFLFALYTLFGSDIKILTSTQRHGELSF